MKSSYEDAAELCRLGCKAINIEKFESARRYFQLAAEMGSMEAAVSLELLSHTVAVQTINVDDYSPSPTQEQKMEETHIFTRHEALAFRPDVQTSVYTH